MSNSFKNQSIVTNNFYIKETKILLVSCFVRILES